ncbi:hypothetical protein [Flavisolibacter ginsenosidimutans]|uniref:Uncharacterized protein n=1 Tax=Flavisolibacter ginsenosidimutans TaxID=661481 RepID=A0A5B8UG34_9BACT|nr:hypothetical protein [Flavisolibacter ginsenosidimutans]QEC55276.1 hypothetical protein FSB75_04930 [Flavisolibacter ginsenosidimutans]
MGTTQRLIPGVTGEPNWPNLSNAITAIVNTVEKEKELEKQAEKAEENQRDSPSEGNIKALENISRQQAKLSARRTSHYKSALKNLIKTGGGRKSVTSGKSTSLGRAGLRASGRIYRFVTTVYNGGLEKALKSIGFENIKGKSVEEIIDYLLMYFSDSSSGMDDVAANMASCQVVEMIADEAKTANELESNMKELIDGNKLIDVLCSFYGFYLFEHLAQRFQERISQIKGEELSRETFNMIKEDILGQVKIINADKAVTTIDWKGKEGSDIQEKIFDSIIQLFE